MADLTGKKVAFIATNNFEDSELTSPWDAVTRAGAQAVLISPETGEITGKKGHAQAVDVASGDASADDYDAVVLPGGTGNADAIRLDEPAVKFVRAAYDEGKPIASICHGAWILTDADVARGHTLTSYPSLKTDLRNAGAIWVDEEVVVDGPMISSRTPKDLPAFNAAIVDRFAQG